MFLEEIRLQNFRCFESLVVKLDRHLNVFVGGNGSGKTAVLDAIALLLSPILTRLPFKKVQKSRKLSAVDIRKVHGSLFDEIEEISPVAFIAAQGRIEPEKTLQWDRYRLRDKTPATRSKLPDRKDLKQLQTYIDSLIDAFNNHQPYKLPLFAYYGTNRAIAVPHRRLRTSRIQSHVDKIDQFTGLEGALKSTSNFITMVTWFNLLEIRELRAQRDKLIPTNGKLPVIECVRQAIAKMFQSVYNPRIDSRSGLFTVDSTDSQGRTIALNLDQLSDGYQVMLGVVMDFALRLALTSPPVASWEDVLKTEAILLIDEVDLHLHPSWQQRVLDDLRRTFPNTQLIVTTHSPQVISTTNAQNIRVIETKDGRTEVVTPQFQTRGVESASVLAEIMKVDPVPHVPEAEWLHEYRGLIQEGRESEPEATQLRVKLDAHFGQQHPVILDCDRIIRFNQFKRQRQTA